MNYTGRALQRKATVPLCVMWHKKLWGFYFRSLKRVSFSDLDENQKAKQYLLKLCRFVIHFDTELFKIFQGIDWKRLVWNTTKDSQYSKKSICHFVLVSTFSLGSLKMSFCVWPIKICPEPCTSFMKQGTESPHEYSIISFKDIWTYSYLVFTNVASTYTSTGNLANINTFPLCKSNIKYGDSE